MGSGNWFVVLFVVYEGNYDAPWVQFITGGVSRDDAVQHAANTERITALERNLPVHMRRGGQTQRHIIQVQAHDGLTALMRAQIMLGMEASEYRRYQLHAGEPDV